MARYRKKPVVVEATQWHRNGDHGAVRPMEGSQYVLGAHCEHCFENMHDHGWIDTIQGGHTVCPGDYIITDSRVKDPRGHGHYYPCKPDIFEATYEPAGVVVEGPTPEQQAYAKKFFAAAEAGSKRRCAKCGRPEDAHNVRHMFVGLSTKREV